MSTTIDHPTLLDEPVPQPILPSVQLDAPRDYTLVRRALTDEADELEKLAKKTTEGGYPREARIIQADANAIRERILPEFSDQGEIPLATPDEVRSAFANELRALVRRHVRRDDDERDHEAEFLDELGRRLEAFAEALAERAFAAGLFARNSAPHALAIASMPALRP